MPTFFLPPKATIGGDKLSGELESPPPTWSLAEENESLSRRKEGEQDKKLWSLKI